MVYKEVDKYECLLIRPYYTQAKYVYIHISTNIPCPIINIYYHGAWIKKVLYTQFRAKIRYLKTVINCF